MPIAQTKAQVTEDQIKQDIQNTIAVLNALSRVIPGKVDAALVEALQFVEGNELLLTLLTTALNAL